MKWLHWLSIRLFGGFLWTMSYRMYDDLEDIRPAGGFRNYTWNYHKKRMERMYSSDGLLTYDYCDQLLKHGHPGKPWDGPGSFGEWTCVGCGTHRGGL